MFGQRWGGRRTLRERGTKSAATTWALHLLCCSVDSHLVRRQFFDRLKGVNCGLKSDCARFSALPRWRPLANRKERGSVIELQNLPLAFLSRNSFRLNLLSIFMKKLLKMSKRN